jgi:hypothetical protein
MNCQGTCYCCKDKTKCVCSGKWSMQTCTQKSTIIHVMNKGTQYEYNLMLCSSCSNRGLWALNNSCDYMSIGQNIIRKD